MPEGGGAREAVLCSRVTMLRDDDLHVELTGRQIVGMSDRAAQSASGLVAFVYQGRRVTLTRTVYAHYHSTIDPTPNNKRLS